MPLQIPKYAVPGQPLAPQYDIVDDSNVKFIAGPGTKLETLKNNSSREEVPAVIATILGKIQVYEKDLASSDQKVKKEYILTVVGKGNEYAHFGKQQQQQKANGEDSMEVDSSDDENNNVIKITAEEEALLTNKLSSSILPQENDIVLCRVTRISARQANVEIIAVENKGLVNKDSGINASEITQNANPSVYATVASTAIVTNASDIGENFNGIIRLQDIRSTERDKLKITDNFKPGDVIRAKIISKGDGSNYYLSTAANDLGVVFAKAKNGEGDPMYALDWETMIEPSTGDVELRKCAKVF